MGLRVEIAWNLVGWSKMVFWVIIVTSPQGTPENGEFLHLGLENCDFAIYNNFCFLNNSLLKSQNKTPLILERPSRSIVYDSAFNSILPFLINFIILLPNRIISAN